VLRFDEQKTRKQIVFGAIRAAFYFAAKPSFFRTLPSTPEFHRIMRLLQRSWVVTTDRELGELPHPAPKDIFDFLKYIHHLERCQ